MRAILLAGFLLSLHCAAQETRTTTGPYYVVFLRPDPARKELAKEDGARIQSAHMANIRKMAADGKLIAAGPFGDKPVTISGMFVFKMDSLQATKELAEQDPTVVEHRNTVDVHLWHGPPGLSDEYFRLHKLDPKTPENMQAHPLCLLQKGSAWQARVNERDSLMAAHSRYIHQLREQHKLGAAGGIGEPDDLLGMVVFKPGELEEAKRLMEDDPAVKAGVLKIEYHRWWSSEHVLPW